MTQAGFLERLLRDASGGEANVAGVVREALAGFEGGLAAELGQLRAVSQAQAAAVAENTQAVWQNTVVQVSPGQSSALASVGKAAWKVFESGLGLSPLMSGLIQWFGGGKPEEPPPLLTYMPPPTVHFEGEVTHGGGREAYAWELEQYEGKGTAMRAAPQITVQVQAMDSRSFLDHSEEIARAVREAMLNSHALNDVVSEL